MSGPLCSGRLLQSSPRSEFQADEYCISESRKKRSVVMDEIAWVSAFIFSHICHDHSTGAATAFIAVPTTSVCFTLRPPDCNVSDFNMCTYTCEYLPSGLTSLIALYVDMRIRILAAAQAPCAPFPLQRRLKPYDSIAVALRLAYQILLPCTQCRGRLAMQPYMRWKCAHTPVCRPIIVLPAGELTALLVGLAAQEAHLLLLYSPGLLLGSLACKKRNSYVYVGDDRSCTLH